MNDTLIDWLGVIVAVVVLAVAARYLGRFLGWIERSEIARQQAEATAARNKLAAPVADAGYEPEGIPAQHIAVIAAAVAAYGFRVVHIADHATGHAWASEGRWMHQTSHSVSHRPH
jgi:hypothetical protein